MAEQDWQNKTARTGLPGKDCQERTARNGLSGQDSPDGAARAGRLHGAARTGLIGQDMTCNMDMSMHTDIQYSTEM
jgi:hypothetical protein